MKKVIKIIIIILVVCGLIGGGIYGGYTYNKTNKVAEVCQVRNNLGYEFNEINVGAVSNYEKTSGEIASDKSQTVYLDSGTEITSVNVKKGDHVNEGDVLMVVKKESQNIKGKELELQKAKLALKTAQTKMDRLMNEEPIPEYISSSPDTRERTNLTNKVYVLKETSDALPGYEPGQVVFEEMYYGDKVEVVYYDSSSRNAYLDEEDDAEAISKLKAAIDSVDKGEVFDCEEHYETNEVNIGTFYYNAETGELLGEDRFDEEGELIEEFKQPEGHTPKELEDEIKAQQEVVKKQDLAVRVAQNQLDVMNNTDNTGEIRAKVSGTIGKVQNQDNFNNTQPFMTLSDTDNYFVSTSISELNFDKVSIGDKVTLSSWESNVDVEGTISYISDVPKKDDENDGGYYRAGNENSSQYELRATIDKDSGLEIGAMVDVNITFNTDGEQNSGGETNMYIQNFLVKKDKGGTYVMRKTENDKLEKHYFEAGRTFFDEIEVKDDSISSDDYLAFPYGNGAIEGAKCKIIDRMQLPGKM